MLSAGNRPCLLGASPWGIDFTFGARRTNETRLFSTLFNGVEISTLYSVSATGTTTVSTNGPRRLTILYPVLFCVALVSPGEGLL